MGSKPLPLPLQEVAGYPMPSFLFSNNMIPSFPAVLSMPSFGGGGDLKDDLQLSESDEDSDV